MSFDFNTVIKNYKFNSILRKCPGFTEKFSVIDSAEKEANENNQKVLDKTISKLKRSKNDFLLLIDVTKEGDNINFIKLIEAFTDDTHLYIVSSKETDMDLYDYLKKHKDEKKNLSCDNVGSFIYQLALAIDYLHDKLIFHSYINSTDIYIRDNEVLKLGGFYNFQVLDKKDSTKKLDWNIFFNCPDEEKSKIGLKYDHWCAGFVLYEMCTLENQRLILQQTDFKSGWKPKDLPREYYELDKTFKSLVELEPKKRVDLDKLFLEPEFLFKWRPTVDSLYTKIKYIGSTIDKRFKMDKFLGKGAFGMAFLVRDLKKKEEIKVLKIVNDFRPGDEKEASLLSELKQENIIKYYEHFLYKGVFMIVTELCNSGDLDTYLQKIKNLNRNLSDELVLDWMTQLFSGIAYAHSKTVLHRDLKPANVMLNTSDDYKITLKIVDFGLSRKLDKKGDLAHTQCGTIIYMSPEIFAGSYDDRCDVWALGCILFQLVTLNYPYYDCVTYPDVIRRIQTKPPEIRNDHFMNDILVNKIFVLDYKKRAKSNEVLKELKKINLKPIMPLVFSEI